MTVNNKKVDDNMDNVIMVTLQDSVINRVRGNAQLKVEQLTKEAREYEKQARDTRKLLNVYKAFLDRTEIQLALDSAYELLESQGYNEKEIRDIIKSRGVTWEVIMENGEVK